MRLFSWLRQRMATQLGDRPNGTHRPAPRCRPRLEPLEDRTVPSGGFAFKTLDAPNAVGGTQASGINSQGNVVGNYLDDNGQHGFLLSGGQYTTLDDPNAGVGGGSFTVASGINARGQIVGGYAEAFGGVHGFLLSGGQYTTLDDPNGVGSTIASGINDHGQIVGYYVDANNNYHGFLLSGGQYTTLDDPNAYGFTSPYGANLSLANGINDSGNIVGYYQDANGAQHGFLVTPVNGNEAFAAPMSAAGGALDVSGSALSGNSASDSGGIYNSGTLTLSASTVTGNAASADGGGIYNTGALYVLNGSNVTGKSAPVGADLYNLDTVEISSDSTVGVIGL